MNFDDPQAGQIFSHYRLLSKLGEGGMGVVYAAEDTHLGRQVAVKFLLIGQHKRLSRARFLREARAASLLSHPNIATVYDYGETDEGRPFIIMEHLRGQTLSDLMATGTLTLEQSMSITRSVLDALCEAHRHGVVHRDIKPSNVVIGERWQVKVLDFGLAKLLGDENGNGMGPVANGFDVDALSALPTQTLAGSVLGTPLYVSPEQAVGTPVDGRSDLFSMGAVLYECLARRPAFAAPSVVEIFARIINPVAPPPPSTFNQHIPPELDRITLKALAKTAADRYQSAEEFLEDLCRVTLQPTDAPRRVLGPSLDSLYRKIVSRGGERRTSLQTRRASRPGMTETVVRSRGRAALAVTSGVLVLLLLILGMNFSRPAEPVDSIAVIPFLNEGHDDSLEYLNDGLVDSLTASLSRLPGLKVISRGSVGKYKGQLIDAAAVGTELRVQAILTGTINRKNDELHITTELIDTRDRRVMWSQRYSEKTSGALAIQQDIVRKICDRLRHSLPSENVAAVVRPPSAKPEAYELYMKGRWYWNKFTREDLIRALDYFNQAIDVDPGFALAYVGVADTHVVTGWVPADESYQRAKAAVEKALLLDGKLGEAHATLGFIKSHYERDWTGAEAEFQLAIELSPGYATAHHWYAAHLLAQGRFERYLEEIKQAQELDLLSPLIDADVGQYYFYTQQYDLAIEHFKRSAGLFPNFYPAHVFLGCTYMQKGMYAEANAEYEKALTMSKRHTLVLALLGYNYAVWGKEAEARAVIRELEGIAAQRNIPPYRFALVYTGLGDKDAAFAWLNKGYDVRDVQLIYINVSPFSEKLRDDPRFTQLVQRLGLTPR